MDTQTDTPLRDQLVRMRIPTNVERRGGGGVANGFNFIQHSRNKRNVEWLWKQSLKAFKFTQHRLNTAEQTVSASLFNIMERMLKQMLRPFQYPALNIGIGSLWASLRTG